ncbi:MAG: bacillithiol system redox-active protein YtxJ [Blastocatellia bacterium]|nr:bacillithiol system redox-active protein YtxJ [Chloracidobacterium sp.]MBL8183335.1 bacillithiol system redox-active protein YtxJ [Blastocatellia bacterium]HBE81797.1 bacillithiol system redox-active protein YtxJ [Blastocatellia bacterium]HRJ89310.1 bacillithiol system redox-active protein YtxJ [Pyrinomonadaceae bacterium]HRK51668.1 bacillithiol system redox-active protein YtxJ [Pyrinomonadaceae bacterium]
MPASFRTIGSFDDLDDAFERSNVEPVVVLKHSNRCGISFDIFEQMHDFDGEVNVVVIQESRAVSDAVAERTGHRHQSPQAFVIRDGRAVYHATHYAIDPIAIGRAVRESE